MSVTRCAVFFFLLFGSARALEVNNFKCSDFVEPNPHYVRLRDAEFDEDDVEMRCEYTRRVAQEQNMVVGFRISKEFESTDADNNLYLKIKHGEIQVTIREHSITTTAYGYDVDSCTLEVIQDESSPDFSPLNIHYVFFQKVGSRVHIKYAMPDIDRWFMCGNSVVKLKESAKSMHAVSFFASSKAEHNIDITSVEINSNFAPWAVAIPVKNQIKHHEQHKLQSVARNSGVNTTDVIFQNSRQIARTWYAAVFAILLNIGNFLYTIQKFSRRRIKDHII